MPGLTFPTGHGRGGYPGQPERASHCRCGSQQMLDEHGEHCSNCGKWTKDTIAQTWQRRAQIVSLRARKRAA